MAKYGSDETAFLLIDGYNVLGDTTEIEEDSEAITEETTPLGPTGAWQGHAGTGMRKAMLAQKGFFNDDADKSCDALAASKTATSRIVCMAFNAGEVGKTFIAWAGQMYTKYSRIVSRPGLHKAEASMTGNGQRDEGAILHSHGTETGTSGNTDSTPVDNGAATTNGGFGYQQTSDLVLGGFTNVVFKIRHSSDNVSFSDKATFTAVTAKPSAERLAIAGTINRYTSSSYSFTGSGSDQSVEYMIGLVRS